MSEGRKHPIDRENTDVRLGNFSDKEKSPEEKVDPYDFLEVERQRRIPAR